MSLKKLFTSTPVVVFGTVALGMALSGWVAHRIVEKRRAWEAWIQPVCGSDVVLSVNHYGAFASSTCYTITCGNVAEKTQHTHVKCE